MKLNIFSWLTFSALVLPFWEIYKSIICSWKKYRQSDWKTFFFSNSGSSYFLTIMLVSNCFKENETGLEVEVLPSTDLVDPLLLFFELSPPLSIWFRMAHVLQFDEQTRKVKDANMQDEDTFEIYDPRNPVNKRRREESKKIMKEKKAKRWSRGVKGQVPPEPCDLKTGHTASRLSTFPSFQPFPWLEHLDWGCGTRV